LNFLGVRNTLGYFVSQRGASRQINSRSWVMPGCSGLGKISGRLRKFEVDQKREIPHMDRNTAHPEKSHKYGMKLFQNFVALDSGVSANA